MGADELSMTYRIIGSATYNNINNTRWSMSPNFAWAHDFYGYGPSSLGGFVPDKQSLSLGLNFDKGDVVDATQKAFVDLSGTTFTTSLLLFK